MLAELGADSYFLADTGYSDSHKNRNRIREKFVFLWADTEPHIRSKLIKLIGYLVRVRISIFGEATYIMRRLFYICLRLRLDYVEINE